MLTIGLGIGPDLAVLGQPATLTQFGAAADRHAGAIQAMMVVDKWMIPLLVCGALLLWHQADKAVSPLVS